VPHGQGPGRGEVATFDAGVTDGEGDSEAEGERNRVRGEGGATATVSVIAREKNRVNFRGNTGGRGADTATFRDEGTFPRLTFSSVGILQVDFLMPLTSPCLASHSRPQLRILFPAIRPRLCSPFTHGPTAASSIARLISPSCHCPCSSITSARSLTSLALHHLAPLAPHKIPT